MISLTEDSVLKSVHLLRICILNGILKLLLRKKRKPFKKIAAFRNIPPTGWLS